MEYGGIRLESSLGNVFTGRYVRSNLNMPPSLPMWGGQRDYDMDAPITVTGCTQARLVGMSPMPLDRNNAFGLVSN